MTDECVVDKIYERSESVPECVAASKAMAYKCEDICAMLSMYRTFYTEDICRPVLLSGGKLIELDGPGSRARPIGGRNL